MEKDESLKNRKLEKAIAQYSKTLYRICFSILCAKSDAEDAVQDTFIKYYTKAPEFKCDEHEKAWLIRVAVNTAKNMAMFRSRHNHLNIDEIYGIAAREEEAEALKQILSLPEKYKIVMDLYYIEGYKTGEIAEIIKITPEAVRKRLQQGRKLLKIDYERMNGLYEA